MAAAKPVSKTTKAVLADPVKAPAKKAKVAAAKKQVPAKVAPKQAPKPAATVSPTPAAKKVAKDKLVRDSFTMPRSDFALIEQLKDKALGFKRPTKKSELLRAGLHALAALTDAKLEAALSALVPLKAGRPKQDSK